MHQLCLGRARGCGESSHSGLGDGGLLSGLGEGGDGRDGVGMRWGRPLSSPYVLLEHF
jgi:hypothetical protein